MFTYVAPLAFVLIITMANEAWDDLLRFKWDKEINEKKYGRLKKGGGEEYVNSESIWVGDIIKVNQNEWLPADLLLLYTTQEETGNIFIRTDQLDGETDWKLRWAVAVT